MTLASTAPRKRRRSSLSSTLGGGLTLLLAVMMWLLFAPQSFGGQFDYATVRGNSMAPGLLDGDAVLIRRAANYHVGDSVAARNPQLDVVLLHRIIADDGVRFTTQGDNRPARDAYEPTRDDVIGKQFARIPHAGNVIRWLQRPIVAVVFGAAVLAVIGVGGATRRKPRRRGAKQTTAPVSHRKRGSFVERLGMQSASGQTIAGSLLLLGIFSTVVAVAHYQLSDEETVTHTLAFTESGRFSYGDIVSGGVYDANRLSAPDPVFLSLIEKLPVSFDYQLAPLTGGEGLQDVVGTHQLVAEVSHPNGWTATIPLENPTLFAGQAVRVEGIVNINDVMRTIANTEERTGVTSLFYTLRVVAMVSSDGTYGGVPFAREIESSIRFRLSKEQLQFDVKESDLESTANVTVGRRETIDRVLPIPLTGAAVSFRLFPRVAFAGFAVAALGFAVLGLATRAVSRLGPAAAIRARYGHLLVAVADGDVRAPDEASAEQAVAEEARTRPAGAKRTKRRRARARRRAAAPPVKTGQSPATATRDAEPAPPTAAPAARPSPARSSSGPRTAPAPFVRPLTRERNVIVESFDDLARLAEQRGMAVLTTHHGDIDEYVVIDDEVTYRFATLSSRSRSAPAEPPTEDDDDRDDFDRRGFRLAS